MESHLFLVKDCSQLRWSIFGRSFFRTIFRVHLFRLLVRIQNCFLDCRTIICISLATENLFKLCVIIFDIFRLGPFLIDFLLVHRQSIDRIPIICRCLAFLAVFCLRVRLLLAPIVRITFGQKVVEYFFRTFFFQLKNFLQGKV